MMFFRNEIFIIRLCGIVKKIIYICIKVMVLSAKNSHGKRIKI